MGTDMEIARLRQLVNIKYNRCLIISQSYMPTSEWVNGFQECLKWMRKELDETEEREKQDKIETDDITYQKYKESTEM